jgi:CRP-like cAMP-binding protein
LSRHFGHATDWHEQMTAIGLSTDRPPNYFAPFLHRVKAAVPLDPAEESLIRSLPTVSQSVAAGSSLCPEEHASVRPCIVASGWACRMRMLSDGRRQILSFILPGDTIGICDDVFLPGTCETIALTDVKVLNAHRLAEIVSQCEEPYSNVCRACELERRQQHARLLDHITRLGQLNACERTAHLLLETYHRAQTAGLATGTTFPLPLTQSQLGDALGFSLVHVNRTLQALRHDGLISLESGRATIIDRRRLESLAGYRTYDGAAVAASHSVATARIPGGMIGADQRA